MGGGVREVWITFTEKTTDQLNTVAEKHRPLGQTAKRKRKEKKSVRATGIFFASKLSLKREKQRENI